MFTFRKSPISFYATLLFTFCIMSFTTFQVSAECEGYIRGTNVNIRADHSTSAKVITQLSNKDVTITDSWNNWYKISSGNITGWVTDDFAVKKANSSKAVNSTSQKTSQEGTIKGSNVNVRSKPTTNSDVVLTLSNKKVQIISTSGDWYKISYNGSQGWVRNDLISVSGSSQTTATTTATSSNKTGTIKGSNVNVRSKPTTNSDIVLTLSNKKVQIISTSGDWYKISYNGSQGWVRNDLISVSGSSQTTATSSNKTGKIKGSNVNVRSKPTTNSNVINSLSNKKVSIISQSGDWYKISSGDTTGWISKNYVSVSSNSTQTASNKSSTPSTSVSSSVRNKLVLSSRGYLGVRYIYGGSTPSGFDCSGFTSYVYKKNGITLARTSLEQSKQGKYVAKSNLNAGDLVFFDTNGGKTKKVNHVGIYIGNNKFIHASSSSTGKYVRISDLSSGFYANTYVTGRTFVK